MTRLEQISELADLQNRLLRAAENVASEVRDLSFGCEDDDQEEDVSSPLLKAVMDDLICFSVNREGVKHFSGNKKSWATLIQEDFKERIE